ncbi:unnamed protein product [Arctogadus glacialis]
MWGHNLEEHSEGRWGSRESECYLITQVEDDDVPFKPFQSCPNYRIDQGSGEAPCCLAVVGLVVGHSHIGFGVVTFTSSGHHPASHALNSHTATGHNPTPASHAPASHAFTVLTLVGPATVSHPYATPSLL